MFKKFVLQTAHGLMKNSLAPVIRKPSVLDGVDGCHKIVTITILGNKLCRIVRMAHSSPLYLKTLGHEIRSIGLSVPHRKQITSQLLAQQVNAIYRLVAMLY
jgi:hypothetical protein